MTPTVVENNLQRAIEKENEIDPEDQEGDLVITRVQSKLRKFFFGYYGTILLVGSNDQLQKYESWIFKNLITNQI